MDELVSREMVLREIKAFSDLLADDMIPRLCLSIERLPTAFPSLSIMQLSDRAKLLLLNFPEAVEMLAERLETELDNAVLYGRRPPDD